MQTAALSDQAVAICHRFHRSIACLKFLVFAPTKRFAPKGGPDCITPDRGRRISRNRRTAFHVHQHVVVKAKVNLGSGFGVDDAADVFLVGEVSDGNGSIPQIAPDNSCSAIVRSWPEPT
jgi:hypothetical protein